MNIQTIERTTNGQLPAFAWPGGYPIIYIDKECSTLCASCATKSLDDPEEKEEYKPTDAYIYYEGSSEFCASCNVEIESAYGDPEEQD